MHNTESFSFLILSFFFLMLMLSFHFSSLRIQIPFNAYMTTLTTHAIFSIALDHIMFCNLLVSFLFFSRFFFVLSIDVYTLPLLKPPHPRISPFCRSFYYSSEHTYFPNRIMQFKNVCIRDVVYIPDNTQENHQKQEDDERNIYHNNLDLHSSFHGNRFTVLHLIAFVFCAQTSFQIPIPHHHHHHFPRLLLFACQTQICKYTFFFSLVCTSIYFHHFTKFYYFILYLLLVHPKIRRTIKRKAKRRKK